MARNILDIKDSNNVKKALIKAHGASHGFDQGGLILCSMPYDSYRGQVKRPDSK